jgi:aspartate kinase
MKENVRVLKFGGTSVGDASAIRRVVEIIAASYREGPIVAVVSAMSGVTNRLVEAAHQAVEGKEDAVQAICDFLRGRHVPTAQALVSDRRRCSKLVMELEGIVKQAILHFRSVAASRVLRPADLDGISSVGERLSCRLLADALCEQGLKAFPIDATELIVTNEVFGNAEPLMEPTRAKVRHRLIPFVGEGAIPVVTGFMGATRQGELTTLGRGGSDLSATIFAAALDAAEATIWTDVDGVLTADPRIVPEARTLPAISYREATELAYFGAKVLHPKTLQHVAVAGIPVWIRNTFAPEGARTKVTSHGAGSNGRVKAIAAMSEVSLITVGGNGIARKADTAAKVFSATARAQSDILLSSLSSGHNDICLLVRTPEKERMMEALQHAFPSSRVNAEPDHIKSDSRLAVVGVVGKDLRGQADVAGRVFSTLGRERVKVYLITQGYSEHSLAFVVEADAMPRTVAALHQEFHLEEQH